MSDTKIAQLLRSPGTHRVLLLADGSVIERSGGSASWRNNNPGNLKFEFAASADATSHAKRSREQALASARLRRKPGARHQTDRRLRPFWRRRDRTARP